MAFKFIVVLAFVAVVSGSGYAPSTHVYQEEPIQRIVEDYDPHPQYTYTYGVNDVISGDSKGLTETRNGDVVHGEYSLIDADGYKRIVKYTADDVNGFNAVVDRQPIVKSAVTVPEIVRTPISAPVAVPETYSVPLAYSAPKVINQAPLAYAAPSPYRSIPTGYESLGYSADSAPKVFNQAPLTYAAPSPYRSIPTGYESLGYSADSAPKVFNQAPLTYAAPSLYRSIPTSYESLGYSGDSSILRALPLNYNAPLPNLYGSSNIAYATPSLVRSPAAAYQGW